MPDPDSLIQLPWKPEVGWVAADLAWTASRSSRRRAIVLKRVIAQAARARPRMRPASNASIFLIAPDGEGDRRRGRHAVEALLRSARPDAPLRVHRGNLRRHAGLGWGAYQNDHEDANGQFEMNWEYADALTTADRHAFFKYMVKSLAEKHGLRATFMPKPFADLTGNGCHAHVSLWRRAMRICSTIRTASLAFEHSAIISSAA